MPLAIEIDDRPVIEALKRLTGAGRDLAPAMRAIGNVLVNDVKLGFRAGTDPYGTPWKPVKRGGQPLVDTGRLRRSIDYRAGADEVTVGTNVLYARVHQFGIDKSERVAPYVRLIRQAFGHRLKFPVYANVRAHQRKMKITARPFFPTEGLPEPWREDVLDIIKQHLGDGNAR